MVVKDKKTTRISESKLIKLFKFNGERKSLLEEKDKNCILQIISNRLTNIFKIEDKNKNEIFFKKLKEACSGDGDEINKITTVYSSSLCALLFFYNISKDNELILTINSNKITFTDVLFEFKNTVMPRGKPSNVDVVLLGKEYDNNNKVILFLESKFFEYYRDVKKEIQISRSYLENDIGNQIYKEEIIKNIFNDEIDKNNVSTFEINDKDICIKFKKDCYVEGIKQMISHYIGVDNLLKGSFYDKKDNYVKLQKLCDFLSDNKTYDYKNKLKNLLNEDSTEIYLGEILFDFYNTYTDNKEEFKEYFKNYNNKYENLAEFFKSKDKELNKALNAKIKLLNKPLTYSLFKDNKYVSDVIKKYYKLK